MGGHHVGEVVSSGRGEGGGGHHVGEVVSMAGRIMSHQVCCGRKEGRTEKK